MKGDFSRDSYQQALGFSRVLLQQGRVLLDADWNEQTSILLGFIRTLTADLLGPHAGPSENLGFAIYSDKSDLSRVPRPLREAIEKRLGGLQRGNVLIGPGHYYVDGVLCASAALTAFHEQPGRRPGPQPGLGERLLYLEVWERHVTANEVPAIREVALGNVDTATRAQVVWQVRAVDKPGLTSREQALEVEIDPETEAGEPRWRKALGLKEKGRLAAQAVGGDNTNDLCELPSDARYRGLEHRLYRVEIHRGGEVLAPTNTATREAGGRRAARESAATAPEFKWSRDNGSVAVPVESISDPAAGERARVGVASLGRDAQSGIVVGSFVELTDDDRELGPGDSVAPLGSVYEIDALENVVVVDGLEAGTLNAALHPVLRRWDGRGTIEAEAWLTLEDGIQIRFSPGSYRAGDYWLIPARAGVPGDVIWPRRPREGDETEAEPLAPHGVERHYAPLALITAANEVIDLRCAFGRLACVDPTPPPPENGQD